MLLPLTYTCAACGEPVETAADPSQGSQQTYVEDCQVCCRPNVLRVRIGDGQAEATADLEE
ncbi:MAG: CPXCG motif-containing cysteine-rich protein [Acidobacteriota bacterium]